MITKIISVFYSLYYNFMCFDFKTAIKMPLFFSYHVKVAGLRKGCIVLESPTRFGMFRMGFSEGSFGRGTGRTSLYISGGGSIFIKDTAYIAKSSVISVSRGELHFGSHFEANYGLLISCAKKIVFGDDCAIGWNCTFLDADGHSIIANGRKNESREVIIGNHAWVCAECTCLKGTSIPNGSVIAFGSVVSGKFACENTLIGGNPAHEIKRIEGWKK